MKVFYNLIAREQKHFHLEFGRVRNIGISKQMIKLWREKNVHNFENAQIRDNFIIVVRTKCSPQTLCNRVVSIQNSMIFLLP